MKIDVGTDYYPEDRDGSRGEYDAGLTPVPYPESVLVAGCGPLAFAINFDRKSVEFQVERIGKNVIANALKEGKITMPPEGIAII